MAPASDRCALGETLVGVGSMVEQRANQGGTDPGIVIPNAPVTQGASQHGGVQGRVAERSGVRIRSLL